MMSDCLCDESAGSSSAIHSDCDFDPHRNIAGARNAVKEGEEVSGEHVPRVPCLRA
jgi:hypothetical protein